MDVDCLKSISGRRIEIHHLQGVAVKSISLRDCPGYKAHVDLRLGGAKHRGTAVRLSLGQSVPRLLLLTRTLWPRFASRSADLGTYPQITLCLTFGAEHPASASNDVQRDAL